MFMILAPNPRMLQSQRDKAKAAGRRGHALGRRPQRPGRARRRPPRRPPAAGENDTGDGAA